MLRNRKAKAGARAENSKHSNPKTPNRGREADVTREKYSVTTHNKEIHTELEKEVEGVGVGTTKLEPKNGILVTIGDSLPSNAETPF